MKIYLYILFALLTFSCANNKNGNADNGGNGSPHIKFKEKDYDFGNIEFKSDASYTFNFKNTGDSPLIIENVKSSCGCTVPEWPKEPIEPGKESQIDVKYNTRISGIFSKTITVYSNANNSPVTLRIRGNVALKAAETAE